MKFWVLGSVEAIDADEPLPLSHRQRALLAALLARAGEVVSADRLAELLWGDAQPDDPAGALHSLVSRLRRMLGPDVLATRPPGYALRPDQAEIDAVRFESLLDHARQAAPAAAVGLLDDALGLWRGPAFAEFADTDVARLAAIRLTEARLTAVEARAAALLECDRPAETLPSLEPFVAEHPLRERGRALLMRALYDLGRHADALQSYQTYKRELADELGLEPSEPLQRLEREILRHEVPGAVAQPPPLAGLRASYTSAGDRTIAYARIGAGPPLIALPAWVSSIEVIASGRDPRSSLLQRLAGHTSLTLYDRYGTGLSRAGVPGDYGLEGSITELAAVIRRTGGRASLLAMSQAGPVAIACAARHPDLVDRLIFLGTYASGPSAFTHTDLNRTLVDLVRTHWGLGSRLMADLYRPGASDAAAFHLAQVLRDSAPREVAAGYLDAVYDIDVSSLLSEVSAPSLVLHYTGDRVVPFAGARQLATALPHAQLVPLDGAYHLPDAADLPVVVAAIRDFLES
ncbi:alpha/beta fold hydrolase [Jiangella sp. DSM 45060]|uniref:alpha/beta fold hydrolase n=1 Tax=Jiangella sp. DSM 45060 TaxID=1798224 RepID=UPI00087D5DF7|nr:alpha/beta fold hydrolase [Jiangella sp. DSM 45060]SDT03967.1 DNA-binding transcriptional activator of the SARP family [Jiangella sp. DSM 45060]